MAPVFSTAIALLATAAAALPALESRTVCKPAKAVVQTANFDDLPGISGSTLGQLPTPYDNLYFQGFDYTTILKTGIAPGVVPHSGSNYAASNAVSQLDGTPMLSVYYPSSKVKSFKLNSFYYGCALNLGTGAAALPTACNVQVTGYKGTDNSVATATQVCSQQFQYNPSSALGAQQQSFSKALKACFGGIQFATVTVSPAGSTALGADLALVLDDVKYSTISCKP